MKRLHIIILVWIFCISKVAGQSETMPEFTWGNTQFYNLNIGDSLIFRGSAIELISVNNHYNLIRVGNDTLDIKVSRRSLPFLVNGFRIFVAGNRCVKSLTPNQEAHNLLTGDVLIGLSGADQSLLDHGRYIFPVSFNDGYLWNTEEDTHMFSYPGKAGLLKEKDFRSHEGMDFDLHDARGIQKHWLVAVEACNVVWVEDKIPGASDQEACILLESISQPGIYYVYDHLYNKNIQVRKGQKLVRGEVLGTIWGDDKWGHLQFAVVKSDTVPSYSNRYHNLVNCFPMIHELYFEQSYRFVKTYSKGKISFGLPPQTNGNQKNVLAFEDYTGKGWLLGKWNPADKVEWVEKNTEGNARLLKNLFKGSKANAINPENWYDYEISVPNGIYRIRARMGDVESSTWQKVEFEGIAAGTYTLNPGEQKWTTERIVRVNDRRLTIRIHVDDKKNTPAGIGEIVFQQAY